MRYTLIALALSLTCSHVMAAKLYKWVDDNGVTQFSQQPPANDRYERMNVAAPPKLGSNMAPAATSTDSQTASDAEASTDSAEQKAKRQQQAIRDAQCAKLREDLTTMENNPRLGRTNADGEMERIGEDERQSMMTQAQEELAENCD